MSDTEPASGTEPVRDPVATGPEAGAAGAGLGRLRHRSERLIGDLAWGAALRSARDVTDRVGSARLLVLAPHPDDETLACGGSVALVEARGGQVGVVVATDGRHARHDVPPLTMAQVRVGELDGAVAALGAAPEVITRLDFEDGTLDDRLGLLTDGVAGVFEAFGPTVVMAPWAHDVHPDHAALGRAARAAVTPGDGIVLLEYVVWAWTEPLRLIRRSVRPGQNGATSADVGRPGWRELARPVRVSIGDHQAAKSAAIAAHRSQLGPSAADLGLPAGDGPLDEAFLGRFLRPDELFFAVRPWTTA